MPAFARPLPSVLVSGLISTVVAVISVNAGASIISPTPTPAAGEDQGITPTSLVVPRVACVSVIPASLPVPYLPAPCRVDAGQVLPDALTAPASLLPTGSLNWAGIHEAAAIACLPEPVQGDASKRALLRQLAAAESPDIELLTALAAPEPPALVLAGFALAAGGLVANQNRRRARTAAELR